MVNAPIVLSPALSETVQERARAASSTPEAYLRRLLDLDDELREFKAKFSEDELGPITPVDETFWTDLRRRASGET